MTNQATDKQVEAAKKIFQRHDGSLKTGEALRQGIHRRTLYAMRDEGVLERLDRGLSLPQHNDANPTRSLNCG